MQCKEIEIVLEQEGLTPLPEAAQAHLAVCSACQNLVADLTSIVDTAHEWPAEMEPPARVWISLRAQLEAEGILQEPAALERASWWHGFAELFHSRVLATAAVGLLIVAAAILQMKPPVVPPSTASPDPFAETAMALDEQEKDIPSMQLASSSTVDTSLRQNLETLDQFIADCRKHMNEQPQDDLAREYLSSAYEQKAELLSAMMDRGGSGR